MPSTPEPTEQDRENAHVRAEIAERQAEAYRQVLAWASAAFGAGWRPSHRHFLVTKEEEDASATPAAAHRLGDGHTPCGAETGQARHFTVEDGRVSSTRRWRPPSGRCCRAAPDARL